MARRFDYAYGRDNPLSGSNRHRCDGWLGDQDTQDGAVDGGLQLDATLAAQLGSVDRDDQMYGSHSDDDIDGGAGDDALYGGSARDSVSGGAGDDQLYGGTGDDQLYGGEGDDALYGDRGVDWLEGGAGDDALFGGAGDDLFTYRISDGSDQVNGGGGYDTLRLEVEDGWVWSLEYGDIVTSEDGLVRLSSGAAGTITLADGNTIRFDQIEQIEWTKVDPPAGNRSPESLELTFDPVEEGAPDGTVVGTAVAVDPDIGDTLTYALTDDADGRFAIDPNTGVISIVDGSRFDFEAAAEHNIVVSVTDAGGLSATGTFTIGVADINEAPMVLDLSGAKVLEGSPVGTVVGSVVAFDPDLGDTLTYTLTDNAEGRFAIDPDTGVIIVADGASLDYETAQHSIGVTVTDAGGLSDSATYVITIELDTSGDDILTGDEGDNVIDGGAGIDHISGLGGNDHLIGDDGADELDGGDGDDALDGGAGNDLLVGGEGADELDGGGDDDLVFGNNGDDHLIGGDGNDQLYGGRDHDVLDGGGGDDLLQAGTGDDALSGGAGQDMLYGSGGADILAGGAGDDTLSGGSDADRFVFTSIGDGVDEIVDFRGDDILAIGDMLVGYASGDEAAYVNLVDDGTNTTVQVDPDGAANGTAFTSIAVLEGVSGMSLDDFVNSGQIDFWLS